jgi:two-component system phosphate regulon response regulator PhoB
VQKTPVLIVENEREVAGLLHFHLEGEGFQPITAESGPAALDIIHDAPPALIIVNPLVPGLQGADACAALRTAPNTRDVPIIMISSRGGEEDVVDALERGAEDFITKPFSPRVVLARVKAVLRRRGTASSGRIRLAGHEVVIDPARHAVTVDGETVELTLTQYRLLQYLAARPGFVRSRDQIVSAVRGENAVLSSRAVDVHVAALRQKLGRYGSMIETVRGVGYRLADTRTNGTNGKHDHETAPAPDAQTTR